MKFPVIADLFDDRAVPGTEPVDWSTTVPAVGAGLLGAAGPLVPPISALLDQLPWGAVFLRTLLALATFGLVLYVIASRRTVNGRSMLPNEKSRVEYRYSQLLRRIAKYVMLPLLVLSFYRIYEVLPNKLMLRDPVKGFVCNSATDLPIAGAHVTVRSGTNMAVGEAIVGTDGYVIIDLDAWGLRPWMLDVAATGCVGSQNIHDYYNEGQECPKGAEITPRERAPIWRITCKPN